MLEDTHVDLSGALLLPEIDVVGHDPGLGVELRMDLNVWPGTHRECIVGTGRVSDRHSRKQGAVRPHLCDVAGVCTRGRGGWWLNNLGLAQPIIAGAQ